MLLDLLLIAALWLGFGFAAGLAIWVGLVVRRASGRKRRQVLPPPGEVAQGPGSLGEQPSMASAFGQVPQEGASIWTDGSTARRSTAAPKLLSFPR